MTMTLWCWLLIPAPPSTRLIIQSSCFILSLHLASKVSHCRGSVFHHGPTPSCKYSSDYILLFFGVVQGSVLGTFFCPLLQSTLPYWSIFFLLSHFFSVDSQFYKRFSIRDEVACREICMVMAESIAETKRWTEANKMKLNNPKNRRFDRPRLFNSIWVTVDVGDVTISPSKTVRNLGVIIDSNL